MDANLQRYLRRSLSRMGWALFLYIIITQGIGALLALIPGFAQQVVPYYLVTYAVTYGVAPLGLWLMLRRLPDGRKQELSLSPRAFLRCAVYCLGVLYLFNFLTTMLLMAMEQVTGASTSNLLESVVESIPTWLYVVLVGVIAPLGEEFIFRGLLLRKLRPYGDRCAIWVSGVAFGLFHMNFYQFFYAAALGMVFAGVTLKTGKLRYAIGLHAIVNLSSALMSLLTLQSDLIATALAILIFAFAGCAIFLFVRYAPKFRHLPPQCEATEGEVMRTLLRCPGIWVYTLFTFAIGVVMIFLL